MMFRNKLLDILIGLLERELSDTPKETMEKNVYDGLFSNLWQNPGFRKYVQDRDLKLIFTLAGGEGMAPEPREAYTMHTGQRVELLILAREAKKAYERVEQAHKEKVILTTEQDKNPA